MKCSEVAAQIHADMCDDDRNGYDWGTRWGGDHPDGAKTLSIGGRDYTYLLGSRDCSSSVIEACRLAIQYTPYAGALDNATYTGNMADVFLSSGLFWADRSPARRGDVYLNHVNHTAMCQDGGADGVYGYDCLSQACINEYGTVYGGQVGDQTGGELCLSPFYEYPWDTTLHWLDVEVGGGEPTPYVPPCNRDGGKLVVDGWAGCYTIGDWQDQLGTEVDSLISSQWAPNQAYFDHVTAVRFEDVPRGSQLIAAAQRVVGAEPDGIWGPEFSRALQEWLVGLGYGVGASGIDDRFGHDSVCALQLSINDGVWRGL
jgi:hypothetical protein